MLKMPFLIKSSFECEVSKLSFAIAQGQDSFMRALKNKPNIMEVGEEPLAHFRFVTSLMVAVENQEVGIAEILLDKDKLRLLSGDPNLPVPSSYKQFIYAAASEAYYYITALHLAAQKQGPLLDMLMEKAFEKQQGKSNNFKALKNPNLYTKHYRLKEHHNLYHMAAYYDRPDNIRTIVRFCGGKNIARKSSAVKEYGLPAGKPAELAKKKVNRECLELLNNIESLFAFKDFPSAFDKARDLKVLDEQRLVTHWLFKALKDNKQLKQSDKKAIGNILFCDYVHASQDSLQSVPRDWIGQIDVDKVDIATEAKFIEKAAIDENPALIEYLKKKTIDEAWLESRHEQFHQAPYFLRALVSKMAISDLDVSFDKLHAYFSHVEVKRLPEILQGPMCLFYAAALERGDCQAVVVSHLFDEHVPGALLAARLAQRAGEGFELFNVEVHGKTVTPISFLYEHVVKQMSGLQITQQPSGDNLNQRRNSF